jgi:hypothetical protein
LSLRENVTIIRHRHFFPFIENSLISSFSYLAALVFLQLRKAELNQGLSLVQSLGSYGLFVAIEGFKFLDLILS